MVAMHTLIAQSLSSVTLGTPATVDALTMFPLLGPPASEQEPFYLPLDQALGDGWAEVTEISEQGSVPQLLVRNKAPRPVFILDGEELVGAKQNRVVNLSILVPAHAVLTIPVSCVEAGRWRTRSRAFSAAPRTQYAAGRASRMSQVTMALRTSGDRHSDQAEVWADIAGKSERLGASSPTGAMEEIFAVHAEFIDRCVASLGPVARQCGALFLIEGRVVGFDLFDSAVTLRRLLAKLVRGVAVDVLDRTAGRAFVSPALQVKVAEGFLSTVQATPVHESGALGLGRDLRLVAPHITGAALEHEQSVVHLAAFAS